MISVRGAEGIPPGGGEMRTKTKSRGGVLKSLFLILLGACWGFMGVNGIWENFSNRTPTEITLAEFVKTRPTAKHLKITQCQVNLAASVYQEATGGSGVEVVFVPVHPPGETQPAHLVIETKAYNALTESVLAAGNDEKRLEAVLSKHASAFSEVREFQGWISDDIPSNIRAKFKADEAVYGFIVVKEGANDWGFPIFTLCLGLLAIFGGIKGAE